MHKSMLLTCPLALLISFLSGCVSQPFNDMINNNFASTQAKSAPVEIQGSWTGSMAYYLVTYKINADGSGIQCTSPSTMSPLAKIKYLDGEILSQAGTKLIVQPESSTTITLKSPYFGGGTFQFHRDDGLEKAAIECKKALSELGAATK